MTKRTTRVSYSLQRVEFFFTITILCLIIEEDFLIEGEEDEIIENELIDEEKKVSIGKATRQRTSFKVKVSLKF